MANNIILYMTDISPPCRAVLSVAYTLGIDIEKRYVSFLKREQFSDWYLKLNPEHTVPTLQDNNKPITDSHAICAYLVDKYGKDDTLYPKDLYVRARCNQRMFFDAATLFKPIRDVAFSIFKNGSTEIDPDIVRNIYASYDMFEAILDEEYLAGKTMTIVDICAFGSITTLDHLYAPMPPEKYPKTVAWVERLKKEPFYAAIEENGKHVAEYKRCIMYVKDLNRHRK
ncbi:glutathione S-transferase 1-like [Bradysia coprophila]|uniref:glutathione S-transferase 1-like n=1 Tax=Bradysia coprophila TaxID=38358 RepID=UPI00187D9D97|nr:glutathione S-transferase 1-like [Bradysia coprophila]